MVAYLAMLAEDHATIGDALLVFGVFAGLALLLWAMG